MTASSALITDAGSAATTGPTAASKAKAIAAAGPIQDLAGNLALLKLKLTECAKLNTQIIAALDSGDGIKTTLDNIALSLS
jgi:hypothetical protein